MRIALCQIFRTDVFCRYFFYATAARSNDEEYDMEESETEGEVVISPEPVGSPEIKDEPMSVEREVKEEEDVQPTSVKSEAKEEEDVDPSLAEWFNVESKAPEKSSGSGQPTESDSETEVDSENEDVKPDDESYNDLDDDWLNISLIAVSFAHSVCSNCALTVSR